MKIIKCIGTAGWMINSSTLTSLLIQSLTGIRSEELCPTNPKKDRLRWRDISLNQPNPEIQIRSDVSMTGAERLVPIPPKLVGLLSIFRLPGDEPIFVGSNLFRNHFELITSTKPKL